jgi:hypothetical protein
VAQSVFPFDVLRCAKAVIPVAFVVVVAGACAVGSAYFVLLPHAIQDLIAEWFLWTVLVLYWVALVPAVVGGAFLAFLVVRARRQRMKRPLAARLLLLCASTLLCLVITETASSVWLAWAHRLPNLPTQFTAPAGDELHVAVIGESSARGQPYQDWLSIGQIVAWKLQPALHGRKVVADVLAREGATLEEMHQKLAGIEYRPDVLIIFAGHNEFQARFPWDQDGDRPGGLLPYVLELVMQDGLRSPFFQCVNETFDKYRVMAPPRIVKRQPIEPPIVRHAESERVLDDFSQRIEAIVCWCDRIGCMPVLIIPPSNESGYEPNRSVLPASVSAAERRLFTRDWLTARSSELEPVPAMARYRALIARHPEFAEAYFRLARLLERSGNYVEASRDYRLAIDLDGFPQRCPTPFQNVYRLAAGRHGSILIDGPDELRRLTPHGILGDVMINDGHHPALRGHVALAEAVLRELGIRRAFGSSPGATPSIDLVECCEHFGIDDLDWATVCSKVATFYKMTAPIRYDPSERLSKAELYNSASRQIAAGTRPVDLAIPGIGLPRSPSTGQPGPDHAVGSTPASGAFLSGLPG